MKSSLLNRIIALFLLLGLAEAFLAPSKVPSSMRKTHANASSEFVTNAALVDDPTVDLDQRIFVDMAHAALDLPTLTRGGETSLAILRRFIPVVGRVFVMAADYVPDHSIQPEEMLIQGVLMGVAIKDLVAAFVKHQKHQQGMEFNATALSTFLR